MEWIRRHWLSSSLLGAIALSFLLYGNSLSGGFVYDDELFSHRTDLRQPSALWQVWAQPYVPENLNTGVWRPLTSATFVLNFVLTGPSPFGFHLLNVLLNGLAVWLVFLVIRQLLGSWRLAFLAAGVFAFLPIHTEAVAYIKSRDEILSAVFGLTAWLVFLRALRVPRNQSPWWLLASGGAWLLALWSKEQSVVFPVIFLVVAVMRAPVDWRRLARAAVWYLPAFGVYLLTRWLVLGSHWLARDDLYFTSNPLRTADFWSGTWTAFTIAAIYIGKTFFPVNLSATYNYNHLPLVTNPGTTPLVWLGVALLAGLCFVAWRGRRGSPAAVGAVVFLLSYALVSKFFFRSSGEMVEEHWLYVPSIGLSLIAAVALERVWQAQRMVAVGLLVVMALGYGWVTVSRNTVWRSSETFYNAMVADAPNAITGHLNLAILYYQREDLEAAQRAIDTAKAIHADHPRLLNLQARMALRRGDVAAAEPLLLRSMQVRPQLPDAHKLYALTLALQGRYHESLTKTTIHLRAHPDDAQLRFLMAVNLYKLGRRQEAEAFLDWNPSLSADAAWATLESFGSP